MGRAMKGSIGFLMVGIIIAAFIIAFAVSQGQTNYQNITVTTFQNITNTAGVTIPFANVTNFNIADFNVSADNVTDGVFTGTYDFNEHIDFLDGIDVKNAEAFFDTGVVITASDLTIDVNRKLCLNAGCTKFITANSTHIIINNTG